MFLSEISIQGFKSFAEKTRLTFTREMVSIVGPNGSGKSNVADAIRWVLGEQSMKLLRGKRAEDVIFAGSDKRSRLSMAEVELRFDNSDHRAPIDGSELSVARRVYRDGTGEYRINNQTARLADVLLLLAKCSVGQRTYAVIGQGMADAFLSTSPLERKVYFDEAAGIRQFQLKREQAVSKLDRTRENLAQAELLTNEIEPRLRSLTRAVKRLERRESVEDELREHQRAYYGALWHRIAEEASGVSAKLSEHGSEVADLERREKDLNGWLAGLIGGGSELAGLESELGTAQSAREQLVREAARISAERHAALAAAGKGELAWVEQRIAGVTDERKRIAGEHTDAQKAAAAAAKRLGDAEKNLSVSADALEKLRKALEAAKKRGGGVPIERVSSELSRLSSEEQALLSAIKAVTDTAELPSVIRQAERFDAQLSRFATFWKESSSADSGAATVEVQEELLTATQSREALLTEVSEARADHSAAQGRARSLADQETRLEAEIGALERQKARMGDPGTIQAQEKELGAKLAAATETVETIQEKLRELAGREEGKRGEVREFQARLRSIQSELSSARANQNAVAVEHARLDQRQVDLDRELSDELPVEMASAVKSKPPLGRVDTDAEAQTIARLKHQRDLIGGIDEGVMEEYKSTNDRFQFLSHQINDLTKAMEDLETAIAELDTTIKKEFDAAFERINTLFQKYFRTLFGGGQSKLSIIRELKPAKEETEEGVEASEEEPEKKPSTPGKAERVITGIEIYANPPGKKLKSIQQLSGGERALTSIALLSAIIAHNPSPFVVLDEVDAALDEANSRRFALILQELARKTQFIAITHNRATMEHANLLYGVTMGDDGISHVLSVKMEDAERAISGSRK